jgi:hypothetical protein
MTRGNALGFELNLVASRMIESNPKAAYAKCCLKSIWNLARSSLNPWKIKALLKILRYQNQPAWCQSMTRGNALGFELKMLPSVMIESNPKAACAKCCLKSLCNPTFLSIKPWKIKVLINISRYNITLQCQHYCRNAAKQAIRFTQA